MTQTIVQLFLPISYRRQPRPVLWPSITWRLLCKNFCATLKHTTATTLGLFGIAFLVCFVFLCCFWNVLRLSELSSAKPKRYVSSVSPCERSYYTVWLRNDSVTEHLSAKEKARLLHITQFFPHHANSQLPA